MSDCRGTIVQLPKKSMIQMSRLMTNQRNGICAQRRLGSAWASAQSDQSSLCTQWVAKGPSSHHADSEDSDQTRRLVGFVMRRLKCFVSGSKLEGDKSLFDFASRNLWPTPLQYKIAEIKSFIILGYQTLFVKIIYCKILQKIFCCNFTPGSLETCAFNSKNLCLTTGVNSEEI